MHFVCCTYLKISILIYRVPLGLVVLSAKLIFRRGLQRAPSMKIFFRCMYTNPQIYFTNTPFIYIPYEMCAHNTMLPFHTFIQFLVRDKPKPNLESFTNKQHHWSTSYQPLKNLAMKPFMLPAKSLTYYNIMIIIWELQCIKSIFSHSRIYVNMHFLGLN